MSVRAHACGGRPHAPGSAHRGDMSPGCPAGSGRSAGVRCAALRVIREPTGMTGGLLLALIVALMATSHLSALHLALLHASRSALERKLEERGELAKRGWILNHIESAG